MRSRNHCSHRKPISVTNCECVSVAFFTHLAKQLRCIILARVAYLPVSVCSTFFTRGTNVEKDIDIKYMLGFCIQSLSGMGLILSINERVITINVQRSSCRVPVIFVIFY